MKTKPFYLACLCAFLISPPAFSQCIPVINDTAACTGIEPVVVNNEVIGAGTTKWFHGPSATYNSLRIQSGGKLIVCGTLQVNDFGMSGGTLIITRSGRLTVNTGGGSSMVFNGDVSIYNLGYFKVLCNMVLDGPDAWTNPAQRNLVWNGYRATFELANTYFVIEKGNCFFVNNGTANFSGIINGTLSDSASVCLGNMSRMYLMLLENRRRNAYVAPNGPACIFIRNYGFSYQQLTEWPSVYLCRSSFYCTSGCNASNQFWGSAALFNTCTSCAGMYLLPVKFTDFTARPQLNAVLLNWNVDQDQPLGKFTVQRSENGADFYNVAVISNYSFADNPPVKRKYFYRILFETEHGQQTFSKVIAATIDNNNSVPEIQPNPVRDEFIVSFPANMQVREIKIFTADGRLVHSQKTGKQITMMKLSAVPMKNPGVYVVQVITNDNVYNCRALKL